MTLLVCPLCGRSVSLDHFDPGSFDQDIYVRVVRGLGQGQGFQEMGRRSALYDVSVISKVKPRLLQLVRLLYSRGMLTRQEVEATIGPTPSAEGEDQARLRAERQTLQVELERLESAVEEEAYDLGNTAGFGLAEGLTPIQKLDSAVSGIKEEFQASRQAMEQCATEIFNIMDVQVETGDMDPQERLESAIALLRGDYAAAEG